ncbi:hypothetical protein [Desulfoscipio geothermicus]|uniref:Uncharacterized protein n=1 Tax=Desulfoscipio geothermicus DSM 3669 TaxID=1121426 RepID=A0A1I6E1B2_9FIRM|nr:hypothetical protein [Desulfoscipio geothermicus]SFR11513.1 hypothetical protein SAMN05660706_1234 [Desulfoscipio geothermicus DSM 3669]
MKKRQVHFGITKFKEVVPGVMVPLSYDFWKPLILYFALRSNTFRVDCWNAEIFIFYYVGDVIGFIINAWLVLILAGRVKECG